MQVMKLRSLSDRVKAYKVFLDAVLGSGPDVQDTLLDLKLMAEAGERIGARWAARFGHQASAEDAPIAMMEEDWNELSRQSDIQSLEGQVLAAAAGHGALPVSNTPSNTTAVLSASDALQGKSIPKNLRSPMAASAPQAAGDWIGLIRTIFELVVNNPALLQLILQLLKPKTA